jgi:ribosomal-protein-alanine N-acetyltransferase
MSTLTIREIIAADVPLLADYWTKSDPEFMKSMGVDLDKIPRRDELMEMLSRQIGQSYAEKQSYAIIWQIDGKSSGHSNINKIIFGEEASMHLHLWNLPERKKGLGADFVRMTLPKYFNNFNLSKIYCEPYAFNEAPNRTMKNVGFDFIKRYRTVPGYLNFEQEVNRWEMNREKFNLLFPAVARQ